MKPSTDAQERFGHLPIGKPKKLTQCEYETGMTAEQLREFHQKQRLRVLERYGIEPTDKDAA